MIRATPPRVKPKPCGCRGPCNCSSDVCAPCDFRGLVRPRFFAGQLLTEEDLQSIVHYTVEKNRLQQRHLFGDGVVCGLQVNCHPCEPAYVLVEPGYALDCCGNDIVVNCRHDDLDVLQMIRELRTRLGAGYDCGDPCQNTEDAQQQNPGDDRNNGTTDPQRKPRTYCLYIRYCEEPSDPVAPYDVDDACGTVPCQPSRIREGYRFELDCPPEPHRPDDLLARLLDCLGDPDHAARVFSAAAYALAYAQRFEAANAKRDKPAFDAQADPDTIQKGIAILEQFQQQTPSTTLQDALDAFQKATAAMARYRLDPSVKKQQFTELVTGAVGTIQEFARIAKEQLGKLADEHERLLAKDLLENGLRFIAAAPSPELEESHKYYALGLAGGTAFHAWLDKGLGALRNWLLQRFDHAGLHADCTLRDEVLCLTVPPFKPHTAEQFSRVARRLVAAWLRHLIECICAAINPPCTQCDDQRVLLACLTVEDCRVVDICNLDRRFVLSPAAVRYWALPLQLLHCLAERFCCELPKALGAAEPPDPYHAVGEPRPTEEMRYFGHRISAPLWTRAVQAFFGLYRLCDRDVPDLAATAQSATALLARVPGLHKALGAVAPLSWDVLQQTVPNVAVSSPAAATDLDRAANLFSFAPQPAAPPHETVPDAHVDSSETSAAYVPNEGETVLFGPYTCTVKAVDELARTCTLTKQGRKTPYTDVPFNLLQPAGA